MGAVAVVVYRVVVVVDEIPAVIRKFRTSIPHVVGDVGMIVVHARVDDGNDDAFTGIAQVPNRRGFDFCDIPLVVGSPVTHDRIVVFFAISEEDFLLFCDISHVGAFRYGLNHVFCRRTADAVKNPERFNVVNKTAFLSLL